ncbi:phosphatases II [Ascobolus immersus RN42]|uniref:protein-tyrosine-phosphatase n=1 Tax=Ascobolus immersus RN42 TaxID=1160509 RepID=A0A3N4IIV4_ASCIM|nr:phosphatases II [Ascobolus immersus RN42]
MAPVHVPTPHHSYDQNHHLLRPTNHLTRVPSSQYADFTPPALHPDPEVFAHPSLPPYTQITPHVYIGSLGAIEAKVLDKEHITHVLSLMPTDIPAPEIPGNRIHLRLDLNDSESDNLLRILPAACDFIENALNTAVAGAEEGAWFGANRVMIHCEEGISRCVAVCVGWLMKNTGLGREESLEYVRKRKKERGGPGLDTVGMGVRPNVGFWKQLQKWQQKLDIENGYDFARLDG